MQTEGLPAPRFLFATCQIGAENALKDELAGARLGMVPAFMRPGFVTFKLANPLARYEQLTELKPCFARTLAVSLGHIASASLEEAVHEVWGLDEVRQLTAAGNRLDLHVWQRDWADPGHREFRPAITPLAEEVAAAIWRTAPAGAFPETPPSLHEPARRNAYVLDVVLVEPSQWWIGYHRADSWIARWPGGLLPLEMPEYAVSRAYLKTSEALQWARPPIAKGDVCGELGCAPGGSSQALLDRGLVVIGIDPAEVDETVTSDPNFTHVRKRARDMKRREFRDVRWLFADMNVAPTYTLDAVEGIVTHASVHVRGLVLTLKLLDWSQAAELPACVDRVRGWGLRDVRLRQLASGGREVCLVALKSRAQRRIRRKGRWQGRIATE